MDHLRRTGPILGFLLDYNHQETRKELKQRLDILLMTFGLTQQGKTKFVISPGRELNVYETVYRTRRGKYGRGAYYATVKLLPEELSENIGFLPALDLRTVFIVGNTKGYLVDGSITFFGADSELPEEFGSLLEEPHQKIIRPYYVLPQEPQRK